MKNNQVVREPVEFRGAGWLIGVALVATITACGASPEDVTLGAIGSEKSAIEVKSEAAKAEHISVKPARVTGKAESGLIKTYAVAACFGEPCPPPTVPGAPICFPGCGSCDFFIPNANQCLPPSTPTPPPPPTPGPVVGWVEGFAGNTFHGWACDKHMERSIDVHFYLDAPAGASGAIGPLVTTANGPREPAVGSSCETSSLAHGWTVDVTPYRAAYAGHTIYVYGISVSGGSNLELGNSRAFTIPR